MADFIVAIEVSRGQNIGTVIRCVVAFGATSLIIVGSTKFCTYGAHGSQAHIHIKHFYSWKAAMDHLKTLGSYHIYGISPIMPSMAVQQSSEKLYSNINTASFMNNACFVLPRSSDFSDEQIAHLDGWLYVPFPDQAYESFIKIEAKLSICLYKFTSMFSETYKSSGFAKEKFDVSVIPHGLKVTSMEPIEKVSDQELEDECTFRSLFPDQSFDEST
jgi:hypothetical protein